MSPEPVGFVLFRGDRCYFRRGSALGPQEIGRLRVGREHIVEFVKHGGFGGTSGLARETRSGVLIYDEALYKRTLVYAALLAQARGVSSLKLLRLRESVRVLDEYSLHFWYTEMLERYRRGGLRGLLRVSKAFRVLYGVDR